MPPDPKRARPLFLLRLAGPDRTAKDRCRRARTVGSGHRGSAGCRALGDFIGTSGWTGPTVQALRIPVKSDGGSGRRVVMPVVRYRIIPVAAPGVAAANPVSGQIGAFDCPVFLQRLKRVG